jgi:AraC-like DNA-binding protein
MGLLLDSRTLPAGERIDSVTALLNTREVPLTLHVGEHSGEIRHRVHFLDLAPGIHLVSTAGTELVVRRSRRARQSSVPERTALTFRKAGVGRFETPFSSQALNPGDIFLLDQTSDWSSHWIGSGGDQSIIVDNDRLQLSVDLVRRAVPNLHRSPVYPLVRSHCATARDLLEGLESPVARAMIAASTTDLIRALIITAAGDDASVRDVLFETLLSRIDTHIDLHLADANLNPEAIARATNISLRQLYNVWPRERPSVAEWIVQRRLDGVRTDMSRVENQHVALAVLARRWGFVDPSHFGRRFRKAYSMTPSEYKSALD